MCVSIIFSLHLNSYHSNTSVYFKHQILIESYSGKHQSKMIDIDETCFSPQKHFFYLLKDSPVSVKYSANKKNTDCFPVFMMP